MTLSFPRPIARWASATLLLAAVAAGAPPSETPGVSVAATPPMGWSSWNTFEKNIDEKLIRQSVDAIVSSGLKDAGYQYVNIDDGWQSATRGQDGNLQSDPQKFPGGMKVLGDYIHSKGLRFGIYTSAGVKTCMRYEGSYNFEEQDTRQFSAWGVDFVKVDWCCTHPKHLEDRKCPRDERQDYALGGQEEIYKRWRAAFAKVDRPMVLSICEWGLGKPWLWGEGVGNMWRTTMDILPCRDCKKSWWAIGWEHILDQQTGLERYAGPGHWNDPDMLIVGMSGLSDLDARAHFGFWCLLAAPMMAGNDVRKMSPETRAILTNADAIAVDQDALGKQGRRIVKQDGVEVWAKPLEGNAFAVILFNRSARPRKLRVRCGDLASASPARYAVCDLWKKADLGEYTDAFESNVPAHDIRMVKMSPAPDSGKD